MVDLQTDNSTPINDAEGVEGTDKTMPIGTGEDLAQDGMMPLGASTGRKRRFNSGAAVIGLVVVVAAIGLYSLRTLTKVSASSGTTANVEKQIDIFLKSMSGDGSTADGENDGFGDELVVLNDDLSDRQVALSDVQKDPFILPGLEPKEDDDGSSGGNRLPGGLEQERAQRKALFESAAAKLRLKSIMVGSDPIANVSGQIVRVNDTFVVQADSKQHVEFRVIGISKEAIEIMAEDAELSLAVIVSIELNR